MHRHLRALQQKWRNLPSLRASHVALLTCRVGGMLMVPSCVRVVHVFPGPSPLSSFCHRPSTSVHRYCRENSQEAPSETGVKREIKMGKCGERGKERRIK